ncbi:MAG: VWA domain-containing protein [Planctomycetes bacterium]|nr:VWA domain-containing protein [Planctomycetota bacterium]
MVTILRRLLIALVALPLAGAGVLPRPCCGVAVGTIPIAAPAASTVGESVFGHPQADAALAALLALRLDPAVAFAADPGASAPAAAEPIAADKECDCKSGFGACQHTLKPPWGITEDPCYCDKCREVIEHQVIDLPDGWNSLCWQSARPDCYLKRHCAAWHLACSECVKETKCCPVKGSANCPACHEDGPGPLEKDDQGRPAKETVLGRQKAEAALADNEHVIVMYNRHFYLCTDVRNVKVKMRSGFRVFNGHEYAHLMLERAEMARKEFVQHFGERFQMRKPVAIFLPAQEGDAAMFQNKYMGSPRTNQLYGVTDSAEFVGGMACNGFCSSGQKYGPDEGLHFVMRHMIGHALISGWVVGDGQNRTLPRWLFEGVGHWLSRHQERFRDMATYCADEGQAVSGSGKGWLADCAKMAGRAKLDSIEKLFGKTAIGQLTYEDHQRAWSYLDLCLAEWRGPFVAMLADLRQQKEVRDSFMKHLECTPEVFDQRWKERVTGKRRSMDPKASEEGVLAENTTSGALERKGLKSEPELAALAARVRALGTVDEPATVDTLLDLLEKDSELVRETVMVALLKMKERECKARLHEYGLAHDNGMVRAYAARACGKLGLDAALEQLRKQFVGDKLWLARAEAAVACGLLQDTVSIPTLTKMVASDSAQKAQLAAMDALGMIGEESEEAVPTVAKHLTSAPWQLRVAACQSLGEIGSMTAVDGLIARMEIEQGHVHEEIHAALKKICRYDQGRFVAEWKKWWEREKANRGGALPERPKNKFEEAAERYASNTPRYYGISIYSNRIGFVLDTSLSMDTNFDPDPKAMKSLSREYAGSTKLQICKEEITATLSDLSSRAHFSIITFNTGIRTYDRAPVAASPGNIESAKGWLQSLPPAGETNYYGGLRAALNLDENSREWAANFEATPDTLTFLTDGTPTQGEITDADTLLEWYTALNRYARIRTHVIAFGNKGVDLVMLRKMAEQNGGKFVSVPEKG